MGSHGVGGRRRHQLAMGNLIRRVPIASGVPGASANVGYSESSAPMCAASL